VSEVHPAEIFLVPSRARRRRLLAGAAVLGVLALVLLSAAGLPARLAALACALAAAWALRGLLQRGPGRVPLDTAAPAGGPAGHARPGLRAEYIGASRIVLRTATGRVVVWRDATDPARYRRLAVAARWSACAGMR